MASVIDKLLDLQRQHSLVQELREKARSASIAVGAKERQVAEAETKVAELEKKRKAAQVAADAKELEIKTLQGKINKFRDQLNQVKTNREYKAIQNEIQFANIEMRRLEDHELAAMEELEQAGRRLQEIADSLKQRHTELEKVKASAAEKTEAIEADVRKAERDLADMSAEVPTDAMAVFDRVVSKHEDSAMAPLTREDESPGSRYSCGGCHMQITQNVYVTLLGNHDTILTCPSCSRILYIEPE